MLTTILTNKLCWFVGSLVNEALEGFLHGIDEALAPLETAVRHVVHFILKVQQFLHHVLVFFRRANDLAAKALQEKEETDWTGTKMCKSQMWERN